ncbi:MAG: hypothetical protein QF724_11210 [Planctomycetota bacterium]|jgi:anti-sigma factor RsiW|nr:hypothetical protein [Planctomycetota bacterium]MDP6520642.1 hypothetical protein [Planctomycetota bacterium]MDP6839497.1 hypothetical protein [Planctomycetota bacterium]MDP6955250.1 hypothetical protein [Planctomycetota bacterium]
MNTSHEQGHEDILEAILVGDLSPTAPRAKTLLDSCELCRRQLAELQALESLLQQAGAEERATLAEAAECKNAPGLDSVESVLHSMAGQPTAIPQLVPAPEQGARRPSPWRLLVGLAAAAALVLMLNTLLGPGPEEPPLWLGSGNLELIAPLGPQASSQAIEAFAWNGPLPPGGWFEIRVLNGETVVLERRLSTSPWTLTPNEQQELPASFTWEVRTLDASGSPSASATGRADFPPH